VRDGKADNRLGCQERGASHVRHLSFAMAGLEARRRPQLATGGFSTPRPTVQNTSALRDYATVHAPPVNRALLSLVWAKSVPDVKGDNLRRSARVFGAS